MSATLSIGQLKQDIIRAYNQVNQQMYAVGVRRQRVEIFGDKILVVAEHQRIPALASLDRQHPLLAQLVDRALLAENKQRLAEAIAAVVGMRPKTVLKDYDPASMLAATLFVFDRSIE
jgi:hypothetical protein